VPALMALSLISIRGNEMDAADRIAIENLIFRYARYVDTAQYEALGELFADAIITANKTDQVFVGAVAVSDYWRMSNKRFECGTPRTHHVITNLEFEVMHDGTVNVRSCFSVFQATHVIALQPIACGRYEDVFARASGMWRFRSKHIEVTLLGDVSDHLNVDIE
jgi:3-phenylpropionate/cinnamic acid dioxygenase small subunit